MLSEYWDFVPRRDVTRLSSCLVRVVVSVFCYVPSCSVNKGVNSEIFDIEETLQDAHRPNGRSLDFRERFPRNRGYCPATATDFLLAGAVVGRLVLAVRTAVATSKESLLDGDQHMGRQHDRWRLIRL